VRFSSSKCVCGHGASPRTPLGEITELHRPLSWFSGSRFAAGEGRGKGEKGEKEGKGRG